MHSSFLRFIVVWQEGRKGYESVFVELNSEVMEGPFGKVGCGVAS